jgi:hypothetical protein
LLISVEYWPANSVKTSIQNYFCLIYIFRVTKTDAETGKYWTLINPIGLAEKDPYPVLRIPAAIPAMVTFKACCTVSWFFPLVRKRLSNSACR